MSGNCVERLWIELADKVATGQTAKLRFLTLLKTFQQLGYFIMLGDAPPQVVTHIAQTNVANTRISAGCAQEGGALRRLTFKRCVVKLFNLSPAVLIENSGSCVRATIIATTQQHLRCSTHWRSAQLNTLPSSVSLQGTLPLTRRTPSPFI